MTYRGVGRPGLEMVPHRRGRRREPRHRQRVRRDPADARRSSATGPRWGEQYVDLQPRGRRRPYLEGPVRDRAGAPRRRSRPPTLLTNLDHRRVRRQGQPAHHGRDRAGTAFEARARTSARSSTRANAFIDTANDNFEVTTALIEDGNTVLRGQAASAGDPRPSPGPPLFTDTWPTRRGLRGDRQRLRDREQLRTFLEDNQVDLGRA